MKLISQDQYAQITKVPNFDFEENSEIVEQITEKLVSFIRDNGYMGVSANQIDELSEYRALVYDLIKPKIMFNPTIVDFSQKTQYSREGCLNVPGYSFMIYRPAWIDVEYQTSTGETKKEKFNGITARTLSMLIDNLNGITWESNASKDELKRGMRKSEIRTKRYFKQLAKLKKS